MNPALALVELRHAIGAAQTRCPWWIPAPRRPDKSYVLFGSTVMWLHELRDEVGDIDVFVQREIWAHLAGFAGWTTQRPHQTDPPFLERRVDGGAIHAFYDWTPRDHWLSVAACFDRAEQIRGWSCTPLDEILMHKREAFAQVAEYPAVEKHRADILLLERHLSDHVAIVERHR